MFRPWKTDSAPKDLCAITGLTPNRLNFLLQIKAVRASVEASRGRGYHNRFGLIDALVATIFNKLTDGGASPKRVTDAIGAELYAIANKLYAALKYAAKRPLMPHFLLVIEPRAGGRLWQCDLVYAPPHLPPEVRDRLEQELKGDLEEELASPILPADVAKSTVRIHIPAFTSARSHKLVFPIGALWLDLQQAVQARIETNRVLSA
jgi:hypothetical protein